MTALHELKLHGVAIYNPDLLSKQELIAQFVARRALLERLVGDLRRDGGAQHHLVIGQRGMGKTTLLRRLRYAIEDDPELGAKWLPLTFPEEQYNVARRSDLYLNCIDALSDALDRLGRPTEARALDAAVAALPDRDESDRAKKALAILLGGADKIGKRLLLLVDNVDLILDRLKDDHWALRELLSSESRIRLIGASAAMIEATYTYGAAFYDYFQSHELKGLTEDEGREVLHNLAIVGGAPAVATMLDEDPGRIRTLHVLSGGNPRTIVVLYDVLARGTGGDVRSDLERLLDQCTPLYKARFEAMPAQSQQIVDALALHWDPISAGELAGLLRLDTNAVSSQLNRLEKQGVVEKVAYHPSSKTGFQVAERFFNIWYLMRASRRVRQRLVWLVEFLKLLYGRDQIREQAARHLRAVQGKDSGSRLRQAEYGLALANAVDDALLRGALESSACHTLAIDRDLRKQLASLVDLEGADVTLGPVVDKHRAAAEIREAVLSAEVSWSGWDAERFAELLGESRLLSLAQKATLASSLATFSKDEVSNVIGHFDDDRSRLANAIRHEHTFNKLRYAFQHGYMVEVSDTAGARSAALALDASELVTIALIAKAELDPSAASIDELASVALVSQLPYALVALGNLLQSRLKRYDEAENAYRKAVALDSTYALTWNNLGNLLWYHLKRHDEAESAYRTAIALDSTYAPLWRNLGNLLQYRLKRYDEAESAYRTAIVLDSTHVSPWMGLGNLLQDHPKRHDEAEGAYRRAIALDSTSALPWVGLGNLLRNHLKRHDEAEDAYRKAVELAPDFSEGWNALAWSRYLRDKIDDVTESAARRAVDLAPDDLHMLHTLATILAHRGNWTEAALLARRFIGEGSAAFDEDTWPDIVVFLREAVRTGHAADAGALLDEIGMADRWRPLREALAAIAAGSRLHLRRVAPEIRRPAEQLLDELVPEGLAEADPSGVRSAPASRLQ